MRPLAGTERADFLIEGTVAIRKSSITEKALGRIKTCLTLTKRGVAGLTEEEDIQCYTETESTLFVPRYFAYEALGIQIQPTPAVRPEVEADFHFEGQLRPHQEPAVEQTIEGLILRRGGLLIARAGAGKTVMALRIIEAMGVKTVVLVHKEFLLTQWRDRIREFLPGTEVGFISQDTCDLKPITIAMIQTVMRRQQEMAGPMSTFGLAICDECHRMSAPIFSRAIACADTEYRLGLTATPRRSDGLGDLFMWHLGQPLAEVDAGQRKAHVWVVQTGVEIGRRFWMASKEAWFTPGILAYLVKRRDRNDLLVRAVQKAYEKYRNILLLSARLEHLRGLHGMMPESWRKAFYIGGMSAKQRKEAEHARIILGTYQMAKEGLDIPRLDTLVFGTPVGSVDQPIGRISRHWEGKKDPFVVDPTDTGGWVSELAQYRAYAYSRLGYEVSIGRV